MLVFPDVSRVFDVSGIRDVSRVFDVSGICDVSRVSMRAGLHLLFEKNFWLCGAFTNRLVDILAHKNAKQIHSFGKEHYG